MKCCFQLVRASDGVRSLPVEMERGEFACRFVVDGALTSDVRADDLVLVIAEEIESDWRLSRAPMMFVKTFIRQFHPDNLEIV